MADEVAVRTDGLGKSWGATRAVDGLTMTVRTGEVYGFVGPNGAGKTTAMRMLLGLVRPTAGTGTLLGRPLGDPDALRRTGALVERPAFWPHLSGRDNLRLLARYAGVPDGDTGRVLALAGLADAAGAPFRTYSLGMQQRLGVAAALLGDPELLVLDEPANGLDPAGMAAMRTLVRGVAASGRTVLLSSHLLDEVEQVCDRVGVLHHGSLVAEGDLPAVRRLRDGAARLLVRTPDTGAAAAALRGLPEVTAVTPVDGGLEVAATTATAADCTRALVAAGVAVDEIRTVRRSLEDVFLSLTGDAATGDAATGDAAMEVAR